jgi:hypothetical protein
VAPRTFSRPVRRNPGPNPRISLGRGHAAFLQTGLEMSSDMAQFIILFCLPLASLAFSPNPVSHPALRGSVLPAISVHTSAAPLFRRASPIFQQVIPSEHWLWIHTPEICGTGLCRVPTSSVLFCPSLRIASRRHAGRQGLTRPFLMRRVQFSSPAVTAGTWGPVVLAEAVADVDGSGGGEAEMVGAGTTALCWAVWPRQQRDLR